MTHTHTQSSILNGSIVSIVFVRHKPKKKIEINVMEYLPLQVRLR